MPRPRTTVRSRLFALSLALASGLLFATTAHADEPKRLTERIGERVSRGVVEESLEVLDDPANRARMGRIVNSPQMRTAMHDLTVSIVLGAVDGLARADFGDLDVARSIGEGMDDHVTPAAGRLTHRVVDAALTASLADRHVAQVEKLAEGSTHAVVAGLASGIEGELGPALAVTLDRDIGPAVATLIERDVMPAVGRGLASPEMQGAIAQVTRSIATELVSGTDEAIDAAAERDAAAGESSTLEIFGGSFAVGYAVAVFFAFALGTMLVVMTVLLARSNRRQRRAQEEAARRERSLLRLLEQLEGTRPGHEAEFEALLRDTDPDRAAVG